MPVSSRFPALAALALVMAGCGGSSSVPTPTIVVDGSSTVFRISQAAQVKYICVYPPQLPRYRELREQILGPAADLV